MKDFLREFNRAASETPRMYFAPLIGAYKAVVAEMRKTRVVEERHRRRRKTTSTQTRY